MFPFIRLIVHMSIYLVIPWSHDLWHTIPLLTTPWFMCTKLHFHSKINTSSVRCVHTPNKISKYALRKSLFTAKLWIHFGLTINMNWYEYIIMHISSGILIVLVWCKWCALDYGQYHHDYTKNSSPSVPYTLSSMYSNMVCLWWLN